jgi:hypothetical protein
MLVGETPAAGRVYSDKHFRGDRKFAGSLSGPES